MADKLKELHSAIESLLKFCRDNDWAGYDPYDALNSSVFSSTPFSKSRFCRIAFTQAMKRSFINFRPLLGVPKQRNPKGLALFAGALMKLDQRPQAEDMLDLLLSSKSDRPYACWGYNFAWQNRTTLVPRSEPNIICTTFAGNALLDAFEKYRKDVYLDTALSASKFLLNDLHIAKVGSGICFSYTPLDRGQVHNANLLGAAFLARLYQHTGEGRLLETALAAARFTVGRQAPDGSWPYGENSKQTWIDNFHTGYNLGALKRIREITASDEFLGSIRSGFEFYEKHFLREKGIAPYFHNSVYPIDIHSIAQSVITLVEMQAFGRNNLQTAFQLLQWAWKHMRNSRTGAYYFRRNRFMTNRNAYMRWSQAWMLLAMVCLAEAVDNPLPESPAGEYASLAN